MRRLALFLTLFSCHTALADDARDALDAYHRQDYATALNKWRSAAQRGNPDAQAWIGILYEEGNGVTRNYSEALRWYQLAAKQGDVDAQYALGRAYYFGQGVLQDDTRAHMWFNIAAVDGDDFRIKYREKAASRMTPQQIAEAQRVARECMSSNYKNCD